MKNSGFIVVGFALLFVQANLFRLLDLIGRPELVPSLVLPLILYMGVHEYSLTRGAGVAFVLGYATDLLGSAPVGLYTFTYVALFLLARAAGVRLAAQTRTMQLVLALAFALVHSVMILILIAIFGRNAWVPKALYPLAVPHILATGAVAPLVFAITQRLRGLPLSSRAEAGARAA
jgi:rod shape-determining protein MreD